MRILVHEFASGGGFAGREVPTSLAREGSAMRTALVSDLAALGCHHIVATADARFPLAAPRGVEVVTLPSGGPAALDDVIDSVDAVWIVAPETNRCLERLAAKVERKGKKLIGPDAAAIRRASNKSFLPWRLARYGIPHPRTRVVHEQTDWRSTVRHLGYPVVVKPARGAGCQGVCLARNDRELSDAMQIARRADGTGSLVLQQYVSGDAASVTLVANGRHAVALTVNAQWMRASTTMFRYGGGTTPFRHPLAGRAAVAAVRACEALTGLRGYIGVDVVLTESDAVVIEVNPRLTTAYLGVRTALEENVAALALAACDGGALPAPPTPRRCVCFRADGRIVMATDLE
jgi:predicted ATP-grasp superfamily ATP-dependent carboligase